MWIFRILGPIKFCKGSIKISNGPLKFENLYVFEWDMGHWPILKAHHKFGLGLTLEKKDCWFGHVELSSGAIKTICDMQIEGKHRPGRPKMTLKTLTERDRRE